MVLGLQLSNCGRWRCSSLQVQGMVLVSSAADSFSASCSSLQVQGMVLAISHAPLIPLLL